MDRLPSPRDDLNEVLDLDAARFDGFKIIEANDDCFRQFGQARHFPAHPEHNEKEGAGIAHPRLPTPPRSLEGRGDIDLAIVEALTRAVVPAQIPPQRLWETSGPQDPDA
jgi:hypothetical protein